MSTEKLPRQRRLINAGRHGVPIHAMSEIFSMLRSKTFPCYVVFRATSESFSVQCRSTFRCYIGRSSDIAWKVPPCIVRVSVHAVSESHSMQYRKFFPCYVEKFFHATSESFSVFRATSEIFSMLRSNSSPCRHPVISSAAGRNEGRLRTGR